MTGFGASTREADGRRVDVEIRSVNHRFLKVVLRLPSALTNLESELEGVVRDRVRRGTVTVQLRFQDTADQARYRLDAEALRTYRTELQALEEQLGEPGPDGDRRLPMLLALPGVVREAEEAAGISGEARSLVVDALGDALSDLIKARENEGEHLKQVLLEHGNKIASLLRTATEHSKRVPAAHRDKLVERVQRLVGEIAPDQSVSEADLLREVCALADRLDITEELERLGGHLKTFERTLEEESEVGRKLDFLLQELNREANTVGSKANDAGLAHVVIELKCEIEKLREQVQNLE